MVGVMPVEVLPNYCNGDSEARKKTDEVTEIPIEVGSRVRCGDDYGTVKFIGEVDGYKGVWYGVEWDDLTRGKHSGVVDGVEYFKTVKPGAGSFVRPSKILPQQTCADAIRRYYGDREDELTIAQNEAVLAELKRDMGAALVEMVGFEKIHQKQTKFDNLLDVSVSKMNVSKAGNLAHFTPNIVSLDVSSNLFSTWREVINIGAQLPYLKELDLSKNRMEIDIPTESLKQFSVNFDSLESLNLSFCDYDWSDILSLSDLIPKLRELIVAHNRITDLNTPPNIFEHLEILKLDENPLQSWSEVVKLAQMSNLTVLSLNDCQIDKIRLNGNEFRNVEVLYLKRNLIADWRSISELDKLKNLKKLYFSHNPVLDGQDFDTSSQLIIAKIGSLQLLNGWYITQEERRGAEYDYLKRYGTEYKKSRNDLYEAQLFDQEHCSFSRLIQKHGIPEDSLLETKPQSTSLTSKLIEITIQDEMGNTKTKKIPSTMLVQKLATLVQRLFPNGGKKSPKFYYVDSERGIEILLDNFLKDLNYFSVKNGDLIKVRWT